MAETLHRFSGMPGVKRKFLMGPHPRSVSGFIKGLRRHRICASAGDEGAVNVYRDDAGEYRCSFCRYRSVVDEQIFKTKADVARWLRDALPRRYERPPPLPLRRWCDG